MTADIVWTCVARRVVVYCSVLACTRALRMGIWHLRAQSYSLVFRKQNPRFLRVTQSSTSTPHLTAVDFQPSRSDGVCGAATAFAACTPELPCCSASGFCGNSSSHCDPGSGCQYIFGLPLATNTTAKPTTDTDPLEAYWAIIYLAVAIGASRHASQDSLIAGGVSGILFCAAFYRRMRDKPLRGPREKLAVVHPQMGRVKRVSIFFVPDSRRPTLAEEDLAQSISAWLETTEGKAGTAAGIVEEDLDPLVEESRLQPAADSSLLSGGNDSAEDRPSPWILPDMETGLAGRAELPEQHPGSVHRAGP
eukprot:m.98216 g.98216  ORF g.98216 m.98216 type:complete len:307 (-) comp8691_c0_seq2:406-1326(-)